MAAEIRDQESLLSLSPKTGIDIPIHVDAVSGGSIAPFTHAKVGGPNWNFALPPVKSINVSEHEFGLVYAGVGWIAWRDESYLPKHLVFELHYLDGTEESYTLNMTEILRVVVRESMSMDLLDRLISDISAVTQPLMEGDEMDLSVWQPFPSSIEKTHPSAGTDSRNRHKARRPTHHVIHRSVC
ncbi:glutamate decarboxylase gad1 [Coniosporium tulheliwenetii]|uniref:Glutamate decarboxylase gad1 n=1 Tax=Coniosporium tulheliwenetii TaxID=3383036 RepID=A0ACC2YJC9_9PEZI|nr:glutamate decarboxylase gad1 [Cladosporium sp. JES 115]